MKAAKPPHPLDLLQEKQWDQALFTTYVLSLSFFETVILNALHRKGCRDIWVIADADGYRSSLTERRSTGVGRDYRLVPAALPHGVFHAKCAYLVGAEGHLLLIGSGNLTFGGWGRNLEVLEMLTPDKCPQAFEDFADFLGALRRKQDVIMPDRRWLTTFEAHSRSAALATEESTSESQPRLLSSVERPIIERVVEFCSGRGTAKQVTVLSPFHDLDGDAVKQIAARTGCKRIHVALPPDTKKPSSFPFHLARSWRIRPRAVRPEVAVPGRPLHAKWIEIELSTSFLTLTGSVNSTTQALCTSQNVEIGVLRFHDRQSRWIEWGTAEIPNGYEKPIYRTGGLGSKHLVYCSVRDDNTLSGILISGRNPSGIWMATLIRPNGETSTFKVQVAEDGSFLARLPVSERFALASCLQIVLKRRDREARGWVQVEGFLQLLPQERRALNSMVRMMNHEEDEDDESVLLDYLSESAMRHLHTFGRPIEFEEAEETDPKGRERGIDSASFDLEEIAPSDEVRTPKEGLGTSLPKAPDSLDRWLTVFRRTLLGHRSPERCPDISGLVESEVGEGDGDESPESSQADRREAALSRFDDGIRQLLAADLTEERADVRRSLFVIWLEVKLHFLARQDRSGKSALRFLREWFNQACSENRLDSKATSLEQHVFTAAALLAAFAPGDSSRNTELAAVHDRLEKFCGGEVPADRAHSFIVGNPRFGLFALLTPERAQSANLHLQEILSKRTLRKDLEDVLCAASSGKLVDHDSPVFSGPWGEAFRALLQQANGLSRVKKQLKDWTMCPHCYMAMRDDVYEGLLSYRVAACNRCGKFVVRDSL